MPDTATDRLAGLVTSVAVKPPIRVATTAAITLSGLQTIDGVALAAGDRVLVKNQASAIANGIYTAGSGDWERALDFNGSLDAVGGTQLYVIEGTTNGNTYWKVAGTGSKTVGTDSITFTAALISDAAAVNYAPDSISAEMAITISTLATNNAFRAAPSNSFSFVERKPRLIAMGEAVTDISNEAWFRAEYASSIVAGNVYVATSDNGGADTNGGTKPASEGGGVGPVLTLDKAITTLLPTEVRVLGSRDINDRYDFYTYDWDDSDASAGGVKIVTVDGHIRIREPGPRAVDLTFTLNTGSTYSAPLAAAWASGTAYAVGDRVLNANKVYVCVTAGTSAGSGGPTETTPHTNITDNTAVWQLAVPPHSVLWRGRQEGGFDFPLTNQTSVANVDSADLSWCVVNGSLSVRIGTQVIGNISGEIEIVYSWDNLSGGVSAIQHRSTKILWVVPEGSSVLCWGVYPYGDIRTTNRAGVYIDAGNARDRRWTTAFSGSYGLNLNNSDGGFDGVYAYAAKADAFHYTGSTKALEVNCASRKAGNVSTYGFWTPSINGSSAHDTSIIARFGCDHQFCAGPAVADAGSGASWNYGVIAGNVTEVGNKFSFYSGTAGQSFTMYLDTCHGITDPIKAETGCAISTFAFTAVANASPGGGTLTAFVPTSA